MAIAEHPLKAHGMGGLASYCLSLDMISSMTSPSLISLAGLGQGITLGSVTILTCAGMHRAVANRQVFLFR